MSFTGNDTIKEIVSIVEDLPNPMQRKFLRYLKSERAKLLRKTISTAQKKVKVKVSDSEIAEMIYQYRKRKNPKW